MGLTFLQISDSHVGFDKSANPNALGTLQEAVSKIKIQQPIAKRHMVPAIAYRIERRTQAKSQGYPPVACVGLALVLYFTVVK